MKAESYIHTTEVDLTTERLAGVPPSLTEAFEPFIFHSESPRAGRDAVVVLLALIVVT